MQTAIDRRTFLGGSDSGAVMGLSKWKTPLELFLSKTGQTEVILPEKQKLFDRGHRWEPIARDMLLDQLEEKYGARPKLIGLNKHYIDSEYDFLSCEIDAEAEVEGEHANLELKTVSGFAAKEWGEMHDDGTFSDEIPIAYACQSMFGLSVTKRRRCIVGALFGADNLVPYEIIFDPETAAAIREKCVRFWLDHVQTGVPPEPINLTDLMLLLARKKGRPVELNPEIAERVLEVKHIRDEIKILDEQKEVCEFEIADFVRKAWALEPEIELPKDNAIMRLNGVDIATWNSQSRSSIDSKRLKKELPGIASQYMQESHFRVLRLKT